MTPPWRRSCLIRSGPTNWGHVTLNIPILESTVRSSEAFKDASTQGVMVRDVKGNALAAACWEDYAKVTRECLHLMEGVK